VARDPSPPEAISDAFESGLLPKGGRILAAVSAGPDSMALLAALGQVAPGFGAGVAAGHVDHGLRGEDARKDAELVERYCRKRAIPFFLRRVVARLRGRSREDAARRLRYAALAEMAREFGASAVATAHTRDDAAETLLLALLRGRPLEGLSGIRERRGDGVCRPLLALPRSALVAFARAGAIPYRRDKSNRDLSVDRNWIRHRTIPALARRFGGAVPASVAASAEALSRDREWIEAIFDREVRPRIQRRGGTAGILAEQVSELPRAALRRLLLALAALADPEFAPSRRELLELERRVLRGFDFRFQAGRRVDFRRRRGFLTASPARGPM
jgi:tRNA(Ile)-lysidine synthase